VSKKRKLKAESRKKESRKQKSRKQKIRSEPAIWLPFHPKP
jgi:hypothetical protein